MVLNSYFNLILLTGAVLSVLLSLYLIFYPSKFYANKILGFLILSWAITDFGFMIQSLEFFSKYPHFFASLDVFTLLFFPLLFIYIKTYLYKDARKIYGNLVHFIPAFLYIIVFMPFFINDAETKKNMILNELPFWFRPLQMGFNLLIILQGIFYTILSLRKLHHFQYFRKTRLTRHQMNSLKWLQISVITNITLWSIGTVGVILEILQIHSVVDLFSLFYLGLTILAIILVIFTIRRPEFFSEEEDIVKLVYRNEYKEKQGSIKETVINEKELLINYIENEKPYLKADLKMKDLVEVTGISYKRISEIFNHEFKKSFFDIINDYRMNMAINLIKTGFHKKHTLPHLAEKAGFNSKTTFNRIFKKYTGQTPSEYIQSRKL